MAVTKIDFKNKKGFWIVEDVMELAFQYIYEELKKGKQYTFSKHEELLYDAESNINGSSRGYLVLMWNNIIDSEQDKQEMIRLLERIVNKLKEKGKTISVDELQSFSLKSEDWDSFWNKPFLTENLLNVFNALIKMLQGNWDSTNYDMKIKW